ncbi:hypothetical protein [Elstera sp.]|jgi:hypothetical protein|uniref:hypothetical protein n=1 Tax=Elstera sp. TaxID=1916664 RepID=UPI0037BF8CB5
MPITRITVNPPGGIAEIDPVKRPINAEMLVLMDAWGVTRPALLAAMLSGPHAPKGEPARDAMNVLIMEACDGAVPCPALVYAKLLQLDSKLRGTIKAIVEKYADQPRIEFSLPRDDSEARKTVGALFEHEAFENLPLTAAGTRIALFTVGRTLRERGVDVHFCFPA